MIAVNLEAPGVGSTIPGPDIAGAVAARLTDMAGQLAGVAPDRAARTAIRRLLGDTFPYSLSDPRYRANVLNPGGLPVEVSFTEADPGALRVDLAPGPPDLGPGERADAAVALAGIAPADLTPWRHLFAPQRFGGFVAAAIAPAGARPGEVTTWSVRHKAYLELGWRASGGRGGSTFPAPQSRLWESAMTAIPGLRPHFLAVTPRTASQGQGCAGPRLYFECTSGLALTQLVAWARELGLMGPALAAAAAVRGLTGGAVVLPAAGLLLAVGSTCSGGADLKVELPAGLLGPDPRCAISAILMARPRVEAAFTRWCAALGSPEPTVVSVRIAAGQAAPSLNVYAGMTP